LKKIASNNLTSTDKKKAKAAKEVMQMFEIKK